MLDIKSLIGILSVIFIAVMIIAFKPGESEQERHEFTGEAESFAVVELFTSEGCSSCPPADKVLADVVEKAQASNKRIFALAFHVDYWNRLGWEDEFSSAEYSQRQRDYACALQSSVYTPQMIINGKSQFVGSNSAKAQSGIENSLDKPAAVSVALNNITVSGSELQVDYKVSGNSSGAMLNVAVVERGIVTDIKRGENRGRTLRHENVVRSFRSVDLGSGSDSVILEIPKGMDMNEASVIAYVQNPDSKEIYGAQGQDLKATLYQAQ